MNTTVICVSGSQANWYRMMDSSVRRWIEDGGRLIVSRNWGLEVPEYQTGQVTMMQQREPFHFGREINRLIREVEAGRHVLLVEDDAYWEGPGTYADFVRRCEGTPLNVGAISTVVNGVCVNEQQKTRGKHEFQDGGDMLAVMTVWLRSSALDALKEGPADSPTWWDERFSGYGYDDDDIGRRLKNAGYRLMVNTTWSVAHHKDSVWRSQPGAIESMKRNRELFEQKWGITK